MQPTRKPGQLLPCIGLLCCIALTALISLGIVVHNTMASLRASRLGSSAGQPTRLRITNGCGDEPMWVAHVGSGALDEKQNVKLEPGAAWDVPIPVDGLEATRFWSKWRCVMEGDSCELGDSGGPGQRCDAAAGCAPPIDTKFEATFGSAGTSCILTDEQFDGCDFVDVSLKDGYTVPYELEIKGDCKGSSARNVEQIHQVVSCTDLSMDKCPNREDLGVGGRSVALEAVNPAWSSIAGCQSPCSKLSFPPWDSTNKARERMTANQEDVTDAYCCPTKAACEGVVADTLYVKAIHDMCPGVNAYNYDEGLGIGTCPAGTKYEMIFYCPTRKPADVVSAPAADPATTRDVPLRRETTASNASAVALAHARERPRLRITNGCDKEAMWVVRENDEKTSGSHVKLGPGMSKDVTAPGGAGSTRYWPKLRCNEHGHDCVMGEGRGPCNSTEGCPPPIDTKLEGTFGTEGEPCNLRAGELDGCDFIDFSLVDGFTVPFKFEVFGECKSRYARDTSRLHRTVDCSALSMEQCPCDEKLGDRPPTSLKASGPKSKDAIGCYSPCTKLVYAWDTDPKDKESSPYCCPTPPESPESCRAGPVAKSKYVEAVHAMCPGVSSFAYDTQHGLLGCPSGTKYELTFFCPTQTSMTC